MDKEYEKIIKMEECETISLCLYVEKEPVYSIGKNMNEIHEFAYMNGYNWEAFLNFYVSTFYPKIYEGMDSDPEAGLYTADYELNTDNEKKVSQLSHIVVDLIEHEEKLYDIVRTYGDEIEWD